MIARLYTAAETAVIRNKVINNYALPIVTKVFEKYPQINSAYFSVAQYWCDNADDEVHDFILYSVLDIPNWEAYTRSEEEDYEDIKDPVNLPGFEEYQWDMSDYDLPNLNIDNFYNFNGLTREVIAAFAAFCKEGSHQDMNYGKAYTPYALFTRTNEGIKKKLLVKCCVLG